MVLLPEVLTSFTKLILLSLKENLVIPETEKQTEDIKCAVYSNRSSLKRLLYINAQIILRNIEETEIRDSSGLGEKIDSCEKMK